MTNLTALESFENHIKEDSTRGIVPEIFLKKLELKIPDSSNPVYLNHGVDDEWKIWLKAWNSCLKNI
jgi:hypothetical protein